MNSANSAAMTPSSTRMVIEVMTTAFAVGGVLGIVGLYLRRLMRIRNEAIRLNAERARG